MEGVRSSVKVGVLQVQIPEGWRGVYGLSKFYEELRSVGFSVFHEKKEGRLEWAV